MLEKEDLQAIRGIVKDEVKSSIEGNNTLLLSEIDVRMDTKLNKMKDEIIASVGDMLEQNVFPQFEAIHRRLDQHDKLLGWQQ